jgi:N-methylhydantoinase A/oxoprolinase/acetone carboxylase beta subunit
VNVPSHETHVVAAEHNPKVLAIDAGGTMTDAFIVDETGRFVVGKAQTTPEDESDGLMRSVDDALRQWNLKSAAPRCSTGCSRGPGSTSG